MMKSLILAVVTTAGLLCSASSADAQFRNRRGTVVYTYPTYSYAYPTYYGSGVTTSSYYYPTYAYPSGSVIYSGDRYYSPWSSYPTYYNPTYYNNGYYNNGYYNNGYYNNGYFDGVNINPSGIFWGGQRIWRW